MATHLVIHTSIFNQAIIPDEIVFKPEWLRYYEAKPDQFMAKVVQGGVIKEIPANRMLLKHEPREGTVYKDVLVNNLVRSMVVDPNHAGSEGRARHAILITGLDPDTDQIYLLDIWAQSMPYDDLMANVYRLADRWKMTEFHLETVAAQKYLKYHIEYRNKIEKRSLKIRELKTDRSKNAKWTRIDALSPLFEQGKIFVRRDQSAFLDEYHRYTHSNRHTVDILDCLGYSPQTWSTMRVREIAALKEEHKHRLGRRSHSTGY